MVNVIKETSHGYSLIGLEDEMYDKRYVFLNKDVNEESMASLMEQFMHLELTKPGERINFVINSPGGNVSDGLAVYDLIRSLESPVRTICMGTAASMGAILFLAGDERVMAKHSQVMIHDASFGKADFSGLKPEEISEKADDLLKTTKILREIIAERTGKSLKEVTEKMKKDSYFKAEEAIEFGLATGGISNLKEVIKK